MRGLPLFVLLRYDVVRRCNCDFSLTANVCEAGCDFTFLENVRKITELLTKLHSHLHCNHSLQMLRGDGSAFGCGAAKLIKDSVVPYLVLVCLFEEDTSPFSVQPLVGGTAFPSSPPYLN